MKELDEILYDALKANAELMEVVGNRIVSTCFEVSPEEKDNTPLPCIIVTDDGWQNQPGTKDSVWESNEDTVTASVEVDAESPKEVKRIVKMVRHAIAQYIAGMAAEGKEIPYLDNVQSTGIGWDWVKPCYHSTVTYVCKIDKNYE